MRATIRRFATKVLGRGVEGTDEGYSLTQFPAALVQVGVLAVFAVFFRVLIMWLYNVTGRSVLLVGLFHSAFNMVSGQQVMPELVPGLNSNLLVAAIVAVLAVVLAVSTRGRLGHESERVAPRTAADAGVRAQPRVQ
jgi:hypothetical protein